MKNHFPFTDYDFYAYLTSGGLTLAVVDFVFNNALNLGQSSWSFVQIVVLIALAYVTGHIIAMLAQAFLETFIVSKVVSKPIRLQLGFSRPSWLESLLGALVGRYYGPLPEATRNRILEAVANEFGKPASEISDPEDIFLFGFQKSFSVEGSRARIDEFRNQYGFCRNVAFVALLASGLLVWKAWVGTENQTDWVLAAAAGLIFVFMFVRFVKFLASFQAEVIRVIR